MDKNKIIETAFEVIKTAVRDWGTEEAYYGTFPHFVDGVTCMVDALVNELSEIDK